MRFTIGFEKADKELLHLMWDEIIETEKWTEGKFTAMFEEKWGDWNDALALTFSSWSGAAMAALEYHGIRGKTVLCPSNTFMATALVNLHLGCRVEFVDCNRDDLCMNFDDLQKKIEQYKPAAVWVVHIGGHIAFRINEIAELCRRNNIVLLEDCAHAHGASWNGKRPGTWGDAGVYSFYATKTVSTGEGGMLVTGDDAMIEFARKYRNYGKPDYGVNGLNLRMSEFNAAIGCVQADRLEDIVAWKTAYAQEHLDPVFKDRVMFPSGMRSGYYKYIVFRETASTGKVYDTPCHRILGRDYAMPETDWVSKNHWCAPIYYKGDDGRE